MQQYVHSDMVTKLAGLKVLEKTSESRRGTSRGTGADKGEVRK